MMENLELNGLLSSLASPAEDVDVDGSAEELEELRIRALALDWDEPLPHWLDQHTWPHFVMWADESLVWRSRDNDACSLLTHSAADVTYNTSSFPSLLSTLDALLCAPHAEMPPPQLLLAYKQRDEAERDLWGMMEQRGIRMELVDEVRGSGEEHVEIWVGKRE